MPENSPKPLSEGGDPADFNVDEVNEYLKDADEDEVQRVLDAEAAGKNRVTVRAPESESEDEDEDYDESDEESSDEDELYNYDVRRVTPDGVSTAVTDVIEVEAKSGESPTAEAVVEALEEQ